MASMVKSDGHLATTPRYVAEAVNHPRFGRRAVVRDNFPHLSGHADFTKAPHPLDVPVVGGGSYVDAFHTNGWRLTGPWRPRRDGSFVATCERA
jgi:hypothetical protein